MTPPIIMASQVGAIFNFPEGGTYRADVELHVQIVRDRVFWFGIARFPHTPTTVPRGINGGRVIFDDNYTGVVSFNDFDEMHCELTEWAFVGISPLELLSSNLTFEETGDQAAFHRSFDAAG